MSSRRRNQSQVPSTSAPASGLALSQNSHQLPFPSNTQLQSRSLQSPQEKQQSQPVSPWSAHASPFGQSPLPFLQNGDTLSTSATAAGELFLFGSYVHSSKSPSDDLYVFSTRDFSTTLLQTSGDIPSRRYGHRAVLIGTILLILGGKTGSSDQNAQNVSRDESFYLLNLVSRKWTRIVVDGPGPGGRRYHTMMLVGSKLFVFGGCSVRPLNDIWALDLNCLTSNPFWESYEPAPGNEKPLPRVGHVSVTTGDRIIIFGGNDSQHVFNDTWSFHIPTRKWTALQCTGSIPSPRQFHAAVLIYDVMYVYGGYTGGNTPVGDLIALNLSTQRWTAFQDIGPSPSGRYGHAMACDGTRVFVLGGKLSPGAQLNEAKPIYFLDTKLLVHPKPASDTVKPDKKTTELAQKLSVGHPTQGQPQQRTLDPASLRIIRDRTAGPNDIQPLVPGMNDKPRRVPEDDNDRETSQLEQERIAGLERQLSEMRAERAQLTDQLAQKSVQLEQAEANVAEIKERAGLEQRKLQAKLDELLVSHAQAEATATVQKARAGQEQRELQAKLDGLLLSRDPSEATAAEEKKRAGQEQRELQAKLDELLLSRDQALEQAQSALKKATFSAAEAKEHRQELAEVHAKLEARESELATIRLRLMDAEVGWAKSKAEADTLRASAGTQAAASLINMDVDRVMRRLMERVRSLEAEMVSLQGNEKNIGEMECRNEG